eukprot:scaffold49487_cov50-Attheya_sp.AAC.3
MCTPRRRCEPEHSRQQNAPMGSAPWGLPCGGTIKEAQRGCLSGQSEHTIFSCLLMRTLRRFFSSDWDAMVPLLPFHDDCSSQDPNR